MFDPIESNPLATYPRTGSRSYSIKSRTANAPSTQRDRAPRSATRNAPAIPARLQDTDGRRNSAGGQRTVRKCADLLNKVAAMQNLPQPELGGWGGCGT
jgi:hypothetical protein